VGVVSRSPASHGLAGSVGGGVVGSVGGGGVGGVGGGVAGIVGGGGVGDCEGQHGGWGVAPLEIECVFIAIRWPGCCSFGRGGGARGVGFYSL